MFKPTVLVILFYILGAISLVIAGFLMNIMLGFVALGVLFLVPCVVLYLELKEVN
ncbi:hypothetical protein [Enterococcus phage Nonaheksakonda]|nr:hypothetical protein [Enterococcus phage Nonaheksakonda]